MYDEDYYRQFSLNNLGGFLWHQAGNQIFGPQGGQYQGGSAFPGGPFPGSPGSFPGGPGGFPGGPGSFPSSPGGGGGGANQPPSSPPPSFIPQQASMQVKAIDSGSIRGCLYRFTYVWTRDGDFWFYPIHVGRRSIAGYRWTGFTWVYFGIDLNRIHSFQCF